MHFKLNRIRITNAIVGTLLIPLGTKDEQILVSVERHNGEIVRRDIAPVRFVPLLGTHGWQG